MISQPAEKWLPDCALRSAKALLAVSNCVAKWSEEWLARGQIMPADDWRQISPLTSFSDGEEKNGIRVKHLFDADHRLVSMLLDREITDQDIRTDYDRQLINDLTELALTDLLDRLAKEFPAVPIGPGQGSDPIDGIELALVIDGDVELIMLAIDRSTLTEFALQNSPKPRAFSKPVAREEALLDQSVQLSALVGRTKLQLAELMEIGVGDVLVLDRPMTKPLDLMIGSKTRGTESASLSLDNDRLTLSIERTADQW